MRTMKTVENSRGVKLLFYLSLIAIHHSLFTPLIEAADPLEKISKKISAGAKSLKNKKVAVLPFPYHDGREAQGSTIVSERLITKLVEQKKLEVIERSLLEKVLKELKLQSSGVIDEQSAKQLGKILGVEAIVSGTLIDLGGQEVEVNARLIQVESGQILVAASGQVERFWKEEIAANQKSTEPEAKKISSPQEKEEMPMPQGETQVLPTGSQTPERPRIEETPIILSQRDMPSHQPPMPSHDEFEEPENLLGREDTLLFEADMGHEANTPLGQQFLRGMRLLKEKKGVQAEKYFTELWEDLKGKPRLQAVAELGGSMSFFQQGRKEKAISMAEKVASAENWPFPRIRATAHFLLGRYAEDLRKPQKAREHYLEVVRLSPFQTPLVRAAGQRLRRLEGSAVKEQLRGRLEERREMRRNLRRR